MFPSRASRHRPRSPARSRPPARQPARFLRLTVGSPAIMLMALAGAVIGPGSAGPAVAAASASAAGRPGAIAELDALTAPAAPAPAAAPAAVAQPDLARRIARRMLASFHWSAARQFSDLDKLWNRESGWSVYARNPYSGAAGIPQADPGWKMASAGPDWASSARTQIRWGLRYIQGRYGSPRLAWAHELTKGWY